MFNIVVALKVWANLWQDKKVEMKCDNLEVVEVINFGKTMDPFLVLCAKNAWLLTAILICI